jgi:hypothetical protein
MSQELITKSELIKWCDQQVKEGKELKIHWEGGGDSGWLYFTIDGETISDKSDCPREVEELIELMDDSLDYGSWAGEFSASGEAIYDEKTKSFEGTDYYGEDDTHYQECDIEIKVPKHLWFDAIEYNIEDESINVDVAFIIRNGFLTEEHDKIADEIKEIINIGANETINDYLQLENALEFRSIWQNDRIDRSSFKEEGDNLVYSIQEIHIGIHNTNDRGICLQLIEDDE